MALDMFPLSEILSSESWIANSLISSNNQVKYQFINEAFPEHPIRNNTVPAPPSSLPYLFWQNIENCAFSAGGMGLIPGQGTKTLHAKQHGKKKKQKNKLVLSVPIANIQKLVSIIPSMVAVGSQTLSSTLNHTEPSVLLETMVFNISPPYLKWSMAFFDQ